LSNTISAFTAYAVLTPPQLKLTYMDPTASLSSAYPLDPSGVLSAYYFPNKNYLEPIILNKINPNNTTVLNTSAPIKLSRKTQLTTTGYSRFNTGTTKPTSKFVIKGNNITINYYLGSPNTSDGSPFYSPTTSNNLATPSKQIYNGTIDGLLTHTSNGLTSIRNGLGYDLSFTQLFTGLTLTNPNIFININNPFISAWPQTYVFAGDLNQQTLPYAVFDLTTSNSTNVSFYQSSVSISDGAVKFIVDKYTTAGTNYSAYQPDKVNEVFFIANTHSSFTYSISGESISDNADSYSLSISSLLNNLNQNNISFIKDTNFTATNTGITLSAITKSGIDKLEALLKYDPLIRISSTANYISTPDIMRVNNMFGTSLFRITNNGNIKTPSVTTYSVNLAKPIQDLYDTNGDTSIMNPDNVNPLNLNNIQNIINTVGISPI